MLDELSLNPLSLFAKLVSHLSISTDSKSLMPKNVNADRVDVIFNRGRMAKLL
jgi:hypothetical protein